VPASDSTTARGRRPFADLEASVERVFSRLKGYRKLNALRVRRFAKVWLHVALSVLTMLVGAVANAADGGKIRRCLP